MVSTTALMQAIAALSIFVSSVASLPAGTIPYSVSPLQQIPGVSNLENLAVRRNGDIILTSIASPSIYQVSPVNSHTNSKNSTAPVLLATIPDVAGLLGIAELENDVFYVVGSNISQSTAGNGVWKLDMRQFKMALDGVVYRAPTPSLVALIPSATLLNGLTRLSSNDNANLLISDSVAGTITRLNVHTGAFEVVIQDPALSGTSSEIPIGVNGIHTYRDSLYFTNMEKGLFAKVPISLSTGTATGPVEIIVNGTVVGGDDFALSRDGKKAFVTVNGPRRLVEVDLLRKTAVVAAESDLLSSASAAAFGRSRSDSKDLYITGAATVDNSATVGNVAVIRMS